VDLSDTDEDSKPKRRHKRVCIFSNCTYWRFDVLIVFHIAYELVKASVACLTFQRDYCSYGSCTATYKYSEIMHAIQVHDKLQVKNTATAQTCLKRAL
jgi:hypothetical protein